MIDSISLKILDLALNWIPKGSVDREGDRDRASVPKNRKRVEIKAFIDIPISKTN